MKNYVIILFFTLLIFASCKKENPVKPPDAKPTTCTYPQGNRLYFWQLDTIALFGSSLGGVWAFSDSDAYVMGYIVREVNGNTHALQGLHWNGKKWDTNIYGQPMEIAQYAVDVTGDSFYMVSVGERSFNPTKPGIGEFNNRTKKWKGYQFQTDGALRAVWTDGNGFFIAAGDNGMIYTKDGYDASWVYSKVPTDFHFLRITGISSDEIYVLGYKIIGGKSFYQIWKYHNQLWIKLYDNLDTSNQILSVPIEEGFSDIAVSRCEYSDSLKLYLIGWESYLFESKGHELVFKGVNLSSLGLPLRNLGRTGLDINFYSPNDYWVFGTRYNFFHWNGIDYQQFWINGLPGDDFQFGDQRKMIKTKTGKLFLPTEISSQVYVVVQTKLFF